MKQIILTLAILLTFCLTIFAQTVPQGMKYQAVARDASGEVMADQEVKLRIRLYSEEDKAVKYSEIHTKRTNKLGLFFLTIGKGVVEKGAFAEVPWSTGNIWMALAIDSDGGDDFVTISDSKLLAVPYAFHAATASELSEELDGGGKSKEDLKYWLVGGNLIPELHETDLDPDPHTLGTNTRHEMIIVTNNTPAINIHGVNQNVEIFNDLAVGGALDIEGDLTVTELIVEGDVNLNTVGGSTTINGETRINNTLDVQGQTTLYDGLIVENETPTYLTGSLNIDGNTEVNRRLNVNNEGPSNLSGTLMVDGVTDLNNALNVNNQSPTTLSGTLDVDQSTHLNREGGTTLVDGPTTIRNTLDVDESTHLNREGGTTLVDGPTTIRNTLDVDESTHLNREGGTTLVDGPTTIRNTLDVDESTHLNREGGTTLVDGPTTIRNTLDVDESTTLNREGGTTTVFGVTTVRNTTESTAPTNGALNVDGGVGIEKNLNVAGDAKIDKTLIVRADGNQGALGGHVAEFENLADGNGICIKVGSGQPQNANNFITFKNRNGMTVGRVEGESTAGDLANNLEYQDELDFYDRDIASAQREIDIENNGLSITETERNITTGELAITSAELAMSIVDLGITTAELGMAIVEAAGDASSTTVCNGPFPCVTAPIPSTIAASAANVAIAIANEISAGVNVATAGANEGIAITNVGLAGDNVALAQANLALAQTNKAIVEQNKQTFINTHNLLIGVTYASGAGDYAEYLPKLDLNEDFRPGEVLGLKNGKVTRNTLNADRIMVVSFKPAVLGALPEEGTEKDFVKVAFLGQILTKTQGNVSQGDYILPSGFHNGVAIAKNPIEMMLSDYKKILGVAWSDSNTDGLGYVNVAVGLNMNDMSGVIQEQQKELQKLKGQMSILADLVPGFREAANLDAPARGSSNTIAHTQGHNDHEGHNHDAEIRTQHNSDMVTPAASDIIYYVPTQGDFETGLTVARKIFEDRGVDMQSHPFWNRLDTDPDYKEEVFRKMNNEMKDALHYHVDVDSKH